MDFINPTLEAFNLLTKWLQQTGYRNLTLLIKDLIFLIQNLISEIVKLRFQLLTALFQIPFLLL